MSNPNATEEFVIDFTNWGTWTFISGWNGLLLSVQAMTGGSAFRLNDNALGILDQNVLGPTPDGWTDLSCDLLRLEIQRGATTDDNVLSRYEAGTCQVTLRNVDGKYNPDKAVGGTFDLGTTVRVLARTGTLLNDLLVHPELNPNDYLYRWFTGRIEVWEVDGLAEEDPVAVLTCVDDVALLQRYDGPEQSPIGTGDTTRQRIDRILTMAGWITKDDQAGSGIESTIQWFGTGDNPTHQATTLAQPAWEQILLAADAASRAVFINGDGQVTSAPMNPNSYTDWTEASWGCDEATMVPIVDGMPAYDKDQLKNIIDGARAGGSQITVQNDTSIARYGTYRWGRNDLTLQNDADVISWAGFILNAVGDVKPRIEAIRMLPHMWPLFDGVTDFTVPVDNFVAGVYSSTDQVPAWDVLNSEITWLNGFGRRHHVTLEMPYTDDVITDTVAIRGVRIALDSDVADITFTTSSIAIFLDVLTLNDNVLGLLSRGNRLA